MTDLFRRMQLIPQFVSAMTYGDLYRWAIQVREGEGRVEFIEQIVNSQNRKQPKKTTENDWHLHFEGKPFMLNKQKKLTAGSLALVASFNDFCKFFCLDMDNPDAVGAVRDKLLPVLDRMKIDYIWEHSGTQDTPRGHLWFRVYCSLNLLRALVKQIFDDAGLNPHDQLYQFELYPTGKPSSMIRLPGGFHLKNGKVNPITYHGKTSAEAVFVLETFINASVLGQEDVRKLIRPVTSKPSRKRRFIRRPKDYFFYTPRKLPLPKTTAEYPRVLEQVAQECQAINTMLNRSVEENFLSRHGGQVHNWGLYLWNMALFNDLINRKANAPEGEKWAREFFTKYRTRDWNSHNWDYNKKEYQSNPDRLFPSCKTWERDFGLCEGCPFKDQGRIKSPKRIYRGHAIYHEDVRQIRLVDAETIRRTTFPAVKARVKALLNANTLEHKVSTRILLASPQGSGKSVCVDELAVELAKKGRNILISVPTGKLALEHRDRIRALGGDAFVLRSHKNHFELEPPEFACPYFTEIQEYVNYGISSRVFKQKFCESCPFEERCPFPYQYIHAQEFQHRIVIMMHAHFQAREAMHNILEKKYDVLFIDEAVVDQLMVEIQPVEIEWTLLRELKEVKWASRLADWLEMGGKRQTPVIHQTKEEMDLAEAFFDQHSAPFRLPEYIRYFNNEHDLDVDLGLHVFTPVPTDKVPVTVITDATPPKEMYSIVFNDCNIEVYGADEVLDYRKMNPDNRVIQVLDKSMSKTSMKGSRDDKGDYQYERLVEWLEFIGDKARGEFKDKRILITTYKSFRPVAEEWLRNNYPDVIDRLLISHMAIGTNEFENCDVQFLLAGVYLSAKDFHDEVYKLKLIANYWNLQEGRPAIPNFRHSEIGSDANIERRADPVYRVQPVGSHGYVCKYPQFTYRPPTEDHYDIVERFMIAKTQQSLRLRYNNNLPKITYVAGNYFMNTFLVTNSVLEEELLGYLRIVPDEDLPTEN